jgi:hypothetical protein
MAVGWLLGGLGAGLAGGIAGGYIGLIEYKVFSKIPETQWPIYPLWWASGLAGELACMFVLGGATPVFAGLGSGFIAGFGLVVLLCLTFIGNHALALLTKVVIWGIDSLLTPILIVQRFKRIVCNHCFRYSLPLRSQYAHGNRQCEHCRQPIEYAREPGKVVLAFGNISPPQDGRVFVLSDPDLEHREAPLDMLEVYIDTSTSDRRLLERFLAFILGFPPINGAQSVQIFYQGQFEDLGQNLSNAIHNTFRVVRQLE